MRKIKMMMTEKEEKSFERLEFFQSIILGNGDKSVASHLQSKCFLRNLRAVRYAAFVIIITSIYWLCSDIMRGGELKLSSGPALIAILTQVIFSAYMVALSLLSWRVSGKRLLRYSFLLYYVFLATTVMILAVTKNTVMVESGMNAPYAGIPLSTYYLFILVLAPLPSLQDSVILGVYCVVMMFVPSFAAGHQVYDLKQQAILGIFLIIAYCYVRDVNAALSENIQKLSHLSYTDPLTGILNRRSLEIYLNDVYENKKIASASILILDIDDFKKYNDHYSHSEGDKVLQKVCSVAVETIKEKNGFLFRYGGEEFVAVFLDYSEDKTVKTATEIRNAIYKAFMKRNDIPQSDRVTVTIGCSIESITESFNREYITEADRQLYVGKSSGKNCVVYDGKRYY